MSVEDQLAGLAARCGEAEANEHVVEARLEHAQKVLARHALLPARLGVVAAELLLEDPVVAARLLLLAKLQPVLRLLRAAATVLAGRVGPALDAALVGEAPLALQEELDALATALLALGSSVAGHLDPPPLPRPHAVVGLRGHVADARDLQSRGLQRADRRLAPRARALHVDLDLLEALLHALASGGVGGDLRGERCRLARPLEARAAGGLPRDHVALLVGERDDRVVEAGLDVGLAEGDVLAHPATAATSSTSALLGHYFLTFFLPATCMRFGPLRVRAFVLVL